MRTTPRPHQACALEKMRKMPVFALRMAQRTGKTWVVIADWVASGLNDLLVVAPGGSYRGWDLDDLPTGKVSEITKHLEPDLRSRIAVAAWVSGSRASRKRCEELLEVRNRPRVLVVNVEALSTVEALRGLCRAFLRKSTGACVVVDESTTIRNPKSNRTKYVLELGALAKRRVIMTGLATPKSPLDLWAQYAFLDTRILGHREFTTFKKRYAITEKFCPLPTEAIAARLAGVAGESWFAPGIGRVDVSDLSRQGLLEELERRRIYVQTVEIVKGYRHEDELREKTEPWSFRVTLDQVREASPPVYRRRAVALHSDQARAYGELRDLATTELEGMGHVTATSVVTRMLALHRVLCGYARLEDGTVVRVPQRRTDALLDELSEYDGKAIVWVSYDLDVATVVAALEKEYGEGCCARFWGGNLGTREDEEARFKSDPSVRFIVATAAAGGRGREWSCADLEIFYSNTYDLEHRLQAEERTEAYDKARSSDRVDLVAEGTVDERILEVLMSKADLVAKIEGADWRRWIV